MESGWKNIAMINGNEKTVLLNQNVAAMTIAVENADVKDTDAVDLIEGETGGAIVPRLRLVVDPLLEGAKLGFRSGAVIGESRMLEGNEGGGRDARAAAVVQYEGGHLPPRTLSRGHALLLAHVRRGVPVGVVCAVGLLICGFKYPKRFARFVTQDIGAAGAILQPEGRLRGAYSAARTDPQDLCHVTFAATGVRRLVQYSPQLPSLPLR
mmetsp:Transcript_32021/g.89644  ORF Transcript_32021/g.89644 Transcript_32021/m.89644 type:complete len:210 (-) Transcript_32021:243-872(-)